MANPYTGNPVPYSDLYGRNELIKSCYKDVNNNIWLLGRRRSGKTSVLYAIGEIALGKKQWFPVYIDMSDCFNEEDIKKSYLREFQDNLREINLEEDYQSLGEEHDLFSLVDYTCGWLNKRNIGLLLLLDEIEGIEKLGEGSKVFVEKLSGVLRRKKRLRTIIAARVLHPQLISTGLFNRVEYIGAISDEEAKNLILQKKNNELEIQVDDEENTVSRILKTTGSEPYLIQYLCYKLYNEDGSLRTLTGEDLIPDTVLEEIFESDFEYLMDEEKDVLCRIAQNEQTDSSPIPDALIKLGYIKQINGQHKIGNEFLEKWLQVNGIEEPSPSNIVSSDSVICKLYDKDGKERVMEAKIIYSQKKAESYVNEIGLPDQITIGEARIIERALVLTGKTPLLKVAFDWGKTITMSGPDILERKYKPDEDNNHNIERTVFYWDNQERTSQQYECRFRVNQADEGSVPLYIQVHKIKERKCLSWIVWLNTILLIIGWYASSLSFLRSLLSIPIVINLLGCSIPIAIPIWLAFRYTKTRQMIEIAKGLKQEAKVVPHIRIVSDRIRIKVNKRFS